MFTISKDFTFSASHQLDGLPEGHPCARLHGHNYTVRLEVAARTTDEAGMVVDYGRMAPFGAYLDDTFDHQHLNDQLGRVNPTAENLALHLHGVATKLLLVHVPVGGRRVRVGVSETAKTWAWYG